jgi:putative transposase
MQENSNAEEHQMKGSRFTDKQIIEYIRQVEAGLPVKTLARQIGIDRRTFYKWKAKFGGMEMDMLREFKQIRAENNQLKKLLAQAELDKAAFKAALRKKY